MDETGTNPSIENQIFAAIKYIENKKKKRTDLERICKVVVSTNNGLSNDDIVNTVVKMHKEETLKVKRYEDGPVSYKINKDYVEMNTLCEDYIVQSKDNIEKKEEENEDVQENEISKEDTVNDLELQNGQNSYGDNVNENEHGKVDERHGRLFSCFSRWCPHAREIFNEFLPAWDPGCQRWCSSRTGRPFILDKVNRPASHPIQQNQLSNSF